MTSLHMPVVKPLPHLGSVLWTPWHCPEGGAVLACVRDGETEAREASDPPGATSHDWDPYLVSSSTRCRGVGLVPGHVAGRWL